MRYISLFSGIEAATVAWESLGFDAVAFSEIDTFPSRLLSIKYPNVPNLGDVTKYKEWPHYESIGIIVGGSPCQSFSIAGLRKGLDDPRGNLMLTYLAVVERYRPQWMVWENVPGVLSSNKGRDFGTFLGALGQLGYGFAYRVLDAQFFGVPQRRQRVFVVGHLGNWRASAAVLFEPESMRGNIKKSRKAGQEIARPLTTRTQRFDAGTETLIPYTSSSFSQYDEGVGTLRAAGGDIGPGSETLVVHGTQDPCISNKSFALGRNGGRENAVFCISENQIGRQDHNGPNGIGVQEEISYTLNTVGVHAVASTAGALTCSYGDRGVDGDAISRAQCAIGFRKLNRYRESYIRRLTPLECERLQGFPDNYTLMKLMGKPVADLHRYKALGNSMAVPVMHWIGRRIKMVNEILLEIKQNERKG